MAKNDGAIYIGTLVDTKGFNKGVTSMEDRIGNLYGAVGKLGKAIGAAFAIGKLVQFGKEAIDLGSDLQEVQNVVDVTFTTMNEQVNEFAQNAAKSAGLSETMAKRFAGTFGSMAKAFGFAETESYEMATALTQLAGDVASFYNITQDEAYTKLKAVFSGETESLKDLGVVMTQNALDSFAMANGYGKTTKQMSEQEKVALRYAFVIDQLSAASGDFVRTQDSWANQTRILSLNFDTFKANIGQALINIFTPFLKVINQIVEGLANMSIEFRKFSELIVGRGSSGGGSPGAALEDIAGGYEDVTEATEAAQKAQKSYTTGLDELTIISPDTTASGGAGASGGTAIDVPATEEGNEELNDTETILDRIKKKVKELSSLFKKGFTEGLGDTGPRLESLKSSFEDLKLSIGYIFGDRYVESSFDGFVTSFTESLGTIAGSVSSIGLTIATNLLGGFTGYLESETPRIQEFLISMFDIWGAFSEKTAGLSDAVAYIFEAFSGEDGQKITEDILAIFLNPIMSITEVLSQFALDIYSFFVDPFVASKDEIKAGLEDLLAGFSVFTGSIRTVFTDVFDLVKNIYNEYISPIFDNLAPAMTTMFQEHLAPALSSVGEFFGKLGEGITTIWENVLKPFINWIVETIMPVLSPIIEAVGKLFIDLFGSIFDIISYFMEDVLGGLVDFLVGVFTLDWGKAWNGIKSIFSGIWNSLVTIVESVVNGVITMINGLINGINSISGIVGINIGTIPSVTFPKLATGAVIPPNAPFMAMMGDQRHGNNLEAPEDLIRQIVREEAGTNAEMMALLSEIAQNTRETADKDLTIGDREIARASIRGQKSMGYSLVTVR